jgi:hypothetical protein
MKFKLPWLKPRADLAEIHTFHEDLHGLYDLREKAVAAGRTQEVANLESTIEVKQLTLERLLEQV